MADNLIPAALHLDDAESIEDLGSGFNSEAFSSSGFVWKVSKAGMSATEAIEHIKTLRGEQELMAAFIGDNLPDTSYLITGEDSRHARVIAVQRHVGGLGLKEYMKQPDADVTQILDFFGRCLQMYKATGKCPDVANIETSFSIFGSKNLIIDENGNPILVDTNFGKTQRSKLLGPIWNRAIFFLGISRGMKKIRYIQENDSTV